MGDLLSSFLGGGGGGLSPHSSTGQSSPFYNESGIYFQSPGSGAISGNAASSAATDSGENSRANLGGIMPQPSNTLVPGVSTASALGGNSLIYLVIAGVAALAIGIYFIFKK